MDVDTSKAEDFFQEDTFKAEEIVNLINAIYDARDVYRVGEKETQTLGSLEEQPVEFTTSSGLTIHKGMEASEFIGRKIFAEDIIEIVENLQIGGMYQSGMMGAALVEQAQPDAKTKEEKYQMPIKGSKMYKANMNILAQVYSDITNQITCYNCDVGCFSCTGICGGEACKGACYIGCNGSCVDNDEKSKFGCKETCNLGCSLDCTDDCEACTGCSDSCGGSCYDGCQGCKGSCVGGCTKECIGECSTTCQGRFSFPQCFGCTNKCSSCTGSCSKDCSDSCIQNCYQSCSNSEASSLGVH